MCADVDRAKQTKGKTLQKKIAALKNYKTEMRSSPHAKSIINAKNLSRHRGSNAGLLFTESFIENQKVKKIL